MIASRLLAGVLFATAAALLAPSVAAQGCSQAGNTFFKNDNLADAPPQTPTGVSVILGLCEGEAAGAVFTLPPGSGPQTINEVVVGFGSAGGVSGNQALVNVEIYDGVSFNGAQAVMGPKVFDLNNDFAADMQIFSTGLNVLDTSTFGAKVSGAMGNFVVAFRMNFNLNGSCASGYTSNFITDNSSPGFFCNPAITPPEKNLIDIQGQGWVDASKATVSGVPLCPLFYAGNWLIRACTDVDTGPVNPLKVVVSGSPVQPGGFVNLTFEAPGFQGVPYVAAAAFGTSPGLPTPFGVVPLNADGLFSLSLSNPSVFFNFFGLIGALGNSPGIIFVPNLVGLSGLNFFVAFITVPPAPVPWGISDAAQISIQ